MPYQIIPIQMRGWLSDAQLRMSFHAAVQIVTRFYCPRVVGAGVCPRARGAADCTGCQERITRIFQLERAAKPGAMATWRAREQASFMVDDTLAAERKSPDPTSEPFPRSPTNPFEEYRNSL
jgi:hypothetical protein